MGYLQWLLDAARGGGMYGCDYEDNKYGSADSVGSGDTYDSNYADGNYGYFNSSGYGHGYAYGGFDYEESETSGGYGGLDYVVEL